jgi:hypothetical protein
MAERKIDQISVGNRSVGGCPGSLNKGNPIRDISSPGKAGGFLDRERALLMEKGWRFDPATSLWTPGN